MLIFLDIDGVMVPAKGWKKPELLSDGFAAFSSKATQVLQKLISDDTAVMLTSSHRLNYSIAEWKKIFKKRGIRISKLKSLGNYGNLSRKDEVLNWFNSNTINGEFVIIDDDKSLNSLPPYLKNNLVLTSSLVGLTDAHLKEVHAICKRALQPA